MTTIVVTIAVPVVAILVFAWLMDHRAKRRGDRIRSADQVATNINNMRRDAEAGNRMQGRRGLPRKP
jgi:Mg2+/citrate symporter